MRFCKALLVYCVSFVFNIYGSAKAVRLPFEILNVDHSVGDDRGLPVDRADLVARPEQVAIGRITRGDQPVVRNEQDPIGHDR